MARKKTLADTYPTTVKIFKESEKTVEEIQEDVSLSDFTRTAIDDPKIRADVIAKAKANKAASTE